MVAPVVEVAFPEAAARILSSRCVPLFPTTQRKTAEERTYDQVKVHAVDKQSLLAQLVLQPGGPDHEVFPAYRAVPVSLYTADEESVLSGEHSSPAQQTLQGDPFTIFNQFFGGGNPFGGGGGGGGMKFNMEGGAFPGMGGFGGMGGQGAAGAVTATLGRNPRRLG